MHTTDPYSTEALLTPAEMASADSMAMASGISGRQLMQNAGAAVAARARAHVGASRKVVVVCGPGNNGGDGYIAATLLKEAGCEEVEVAALGDPGALKGDAAWARDRWPGPIRSALPDISPQDYVIDAMFGAGLGRAIEGVAAQWVEAVNASGAYVLSVDLPSGISGESGQVQGIAVRANETVTFFRLKPGHVLLPGRIHCGGIHRTDIGIGEDVLDKIAPRLWRNDWSLWQDGFPRPAAGGHKYGRGHLTVIAGPALGSGASRLSARAGLRIGAGLVTMAAEGDALPVIAGHTTSVMVQDIGDGQAWSNMLADGRRNAFVIGPGTGVNERTRHLTADILAKGRAAVLDADAISVFADEPEALFAAIKAHGADVVLTPHEGEFVRIFPDLSAGSKVERARAAAVRAGATIVLKGGDTVVAMPDGLATASPIAAPYLATAGTGDVLAGFIGGLMAQGLSGGQAAGAAVWLHATLGEGLGSGLIAEDLPEALPALLRQLLA